MDLSQDSLLAIEDEELTLGRSLKLTAIEVEVATVGLLLCADLLNTCRTLGGDDVEVVELSLA